MTQNPAEMSNDEIRGLPIGSFKTVDEPLTPDDRANGMCGKFKRRVLQTKCVALAPHQQSIWVDRSTGEVFKFGQWETGEWYREFLIEGMNS